MNKTILIFIFAGMFIIACATVQERLAIRECKFSLVSVTAHDFEFYNMKLDFQLKVENPNKVNAQLDKLTYTFYANETDVFSGTTGQGIQIPAGKSKNFTTTITLEYNKIGQALIEAITMEKAEYRLEAKSYIKTPLGEISYPVEIVLE